MKCDFCGCTDECACPEGCYWFAEDVCSTCAPQLIAVLYAAGKEKIAKRLFRLAKVQKLLPSNTLRIAGKWRDSSPKKAVRA
jgi:hypothetical protein